MRTRQHQIVMNQHLISMNQTCCALILHQCLSAVYSHPPHLRFYVSELLIDKKVATDFNMSRLDDIAMHHKNTKRYILRCIDAVLPPRPTPHVLLFSFPHYHTTPVPKLYFSHSRTTTITPLTARRSSCFHTSL